jgi:phage terminase large subunit-like protein
VVGQVWGVSYDSYHYVLIEQIRARLSFSDTLSAIKRFYFKYPQSSAHIIEEKANGSAIIDMLRDEIPISDRFIKKGENHVHVNIFEYRGLLYTL